MLQTLSKAGVTRMVRYYLDSVAPLERMERARTETWRAQKHVGTKTMKKVSTILLKRFEPVLCAVLEHMDANEESGMNVWTSASEFECGTSSIDRVSRSQSRTILPSTGNYATDDKQMRSRKHEDGTIDTWETFTKQESISKYNLPLLRSQYMHRAQSENFARIASESDKARQIDVVESKTTDSKDEVDHGEVVLNESWLSVTPAVDAERRILGFFFAGSSSLAGFSLVQITADGKISTIDVGVVDVSSKELEGHGKKCEGLVAEILPLLTPHPCSVVMLTDSDFTQAGKLDIMSLKMKAAIEIQLARLDIPLLEVRKYIWYLSCPHTHNTHNTHNTHPQRSSIVGTLAHIVSGRYKDVDRVRHSEWARGRAYDQGSH